MEPIVVENIFNAPVNKVWQALTDKEKMAQWYFKLEDFRPEAGFIFEFTGGPEDGIQYLHRCEIIEVVPNKKLKHTWTYVGYPGESLVTWELFDEGDKTRLRLTHSWLESFPADNADFAKENFATGWNYIINSSLLNYLQG
jgi:uncharacterized protein YndB with AHSA1/START domain